MGLFDLMEEERMEIANEKVVAPISGRILPLEEVPDEVFAQKMVGDGVAIEPTASGYMLAPASGKVQKIFITNHAFTIVTAGRAEIFVHFGIDTVKLEGAGFERLVEEGDEVEVGTPLIKFDYEYVKANTKSVISPVIISNYEDYAVMEKKYGEAEAGKTEILNLTK